MCGDSLENHPSRLRWSRSAVARASDLEADCWIVAIEISERWMRDVFDPPLRSCLPGFFERTVTLKHLQNFARRWLRKLQFKREASCVLNAF